MKKIEKDEFYQHLRDFLKAKGISLEDGSYAHRIQQSCHLLADAINATQSTAARAKGEVDKALDRLRQSIHDATAPKAPPASTGPQPSATGEPEGNPAPAPDNPVQ
jgi:hypothetical protein